jgi:hypothetical protein
MPCAQYEKVGLSELVLAPGGGEGSPSGGGNERGGPPSSEPEPNKMWPTEKVLQEARLMHGRDFAAALEGRAS